MCVCIHICNKDMYTYVYVHVCVNVMYMYTLCIQCYTKRGAILHLGCLPQVQNFMGQYFQEQRLDFSEI